MSLRTEYLVVLDLETTGLNPDYDIPLEVAMLVVRAADLEVLWSTSAILATPNPISLLTETLPSAVREMHNKSGLLNLLTIAEAHPRLYQRHSLETTLANALDRMTTALMADAPGYVYPQATTAVPWITLCGYSIHFDLSFLKRHAPQFVTCCDHRMLDVSSLRRCAAQWSPHLVPAQSSTHRALDDCYAALDELRGYRQLFPASPV